MAHSDLYPFASIAPTSAFPSYQGDLAGSLHSGGRSQLLSSTPFIHTAAPPPPGVSVFTFYWITPFSISNILIFLPDSFDATSLLAAAQFLSLFMQQNQNLKNCICSLSPIPYSYLFLNPFHLGSYLHYSLEMLLSRLPSS